MKQSSCARYLEACNESREGKGREGKGREGKGREGSRDAPRSIVYMNLGEVYQYCSALGCEFCESEKTIQIVWKLDTTDPL